MSTSLALFLGLFWIGLGIFFMGVGVLWWVSILAKEKKE
jgi:fucose permease